MGEAPWRLVTWDTEFFGFPVAQLDAPAVDVDLMTAALAWCRARDVRCLYYLARSADAASQRAVQAGGAQFMDARVTLAHPLLAVEAAEEQADIGPPTDAERAALVRFAPLLAEGSRFSADPGFGADAARRLYTRWLQYPVEASFVARTAAGVGGVITCQTHATETGKLGLIELLCVDPAYQQRGLGAALCRRALDWFAGQGCAAAQVITQGHNIASQRVYQRVGFRTARVDFWFHRWFE